MKKSFLRKLLTMVMCVMLVLGTLSGCSNKEKVQDTQTGKEEHEPLTIFCLNDMVTEHFIESLQEKYPEINLEVKSYKGSNGSGFANYTLEQGDIPDIYLSTQFFVPESQREYLLDLSGYDFINNYTTTMLNTIDNEGGIYLLPCSYQLTGINYNKTIMEENGWEVPNSIEELEALAPEIEAAGYDVMRGMFNLDGYPFNYLFNIGNTKFFSTAEGEQWKKDFVTGKAKASGNEELLESVRYFKRWIDSGLIQPSDMEAGSEPQEAFLNGECVFFLSLGHIEYTHTTEDGREYNFGVMPWLSEDGSSNMLTRNVCCHFGVNKELAEEKNQQKMEDALKIMEFLSSEEGQKAFVEQAENSWLYNTPLVGGDISEESPYYIWNSLVTSGNTVPLVYVGWEDLIIPIAQDIKQLINSEITPEQLLEEFDKSYNDVTGKNESVMAVAETDMTLQDTAKLCGNAVGIAADAEVALVSLSGYHEGKQNAYGVNWYFYAGEIDTQVINMFRTKSDTISVLEMTGAEIKALVEKGFDLYGDGDTFEYVLVTKEGLVLEDNTIYKVAVGTNELTNDLKENATVVEISTKDAIINYVTTLGTFGPEDIVWK